MRGIIAAAIIAGILCGAAWGAGVYLTPTPDMGGGSTAVTVLWDDAGGIAWDDAGGIEFDDRS
jgi:ABC-type transporter Mla subunit MlaD